MNGPVAVTGASGFIGAVLVSRMVDRGMAVRRVLRRPGPALPGVEDAVVGEIGPDTDFAASVRGVAAVVHLAGRAHVLKETDPDPAAAFRRVNLEGSMRLAEAAAAAGAGRFVFISTIGVNGRATTDRPFSETDPARPWSPYADSKWEAEQALAGRTGLPLTVIRPPLVYGPGAKGNLERLLKAVARGIPLPLGGVRNRRSLVGVSNLADLILLALTRDEAVGRVFLAADCHPSTPELIRSMAEGMGRKARLASVPPVLLKTAFSLLGRAALYDHLCASLEIDSGAAHRLLGWTPRVPMAEEMAAMARAFAGEGRNG